MGITYSAEEQAIYDRNTYRGPLPARTEPPKPAEPTVHPLAGRSPGVRSTSRQALKSIKSKLGPRQMEVLRTIQGAKRPVNDRELTGFLGWPVSSVNARRNELVEMGKVKEAFRRVDPATNKRVIYWAAVTAEAQS